MLLLGDVDGVTPSARGRWFGSKGWTLIVVVMVLTGLPDPGLAVSPAVLPSTFKRCFGRCLNALKPIEEIVFLPGEPGYIERMGWSFEPDPKDKPVAFADCKTKRQIRCAMRCAKRWNIGVCPRAGGHSRIGSSMCTGIVIDVWQFKQFSLSRDQNYVTVGAGLTLGELAHQLDGHDKIFPVGHCPSVGLTGFLLAGGLSEIANDLGLACDNLKEIQMVTPNGVRIANATKNQQLLWASCGGGGGRLGIAYEMRLRVHDASKYDQYVSFMTRVKNDVPGFLEHYMKWGSRDPSILTRLKLIFSQRNSTALILFNGACIGTTVRSVCRKRLQKAGFFRYQLNQLAFRTGKGAMRLLEFLATASFKMPSPGTFFHDNSASHSMGRYVRTTDFVGGYGLKFNANHPPSKSFFKRVIRTSYRECQIRGNQKCSYVFQNLGEAITSVGPQQTAVYGLRKATHWLSIRVLGAELSKSKVTMRHLAAQFSDVTLGGFLNYEDTTLKNYADAYYGPNWRRLTKIVRTLDPTGMLIAKQPIPVLS
eukprot:CAMPEP_0184690512 /NCGR_PEP_ID=MMETSP0312-20130426/31271_1 /TAXON_ID=31354 /ORGANISM="Compsopogon coeruleus, Strain SAG 36.94" /LENGTH=535 /DNA_ID=CAMNT_0027148019 /DNA_START=233 /DNA_END=1840 /DNA_ORIENTATION=+